MIRAAKFALVAALAFLCMLPAPAMAQDGEPDTSEYFRLNPKEDGWEIKDLFRAISEARGISILFDDNNAVIKSKRVNFIGEQVIHQDRLFHWLQAVLSYHSLVLVPVGPESPSGQQQWFAVDQANANLTSRPVYIQESEILDFADRDGLYVVTSMTLEHIKDTSRVRQALSQLSTKTAGLGRINDIQGSRALIVGDFAPIVAAMKQLLNVMDQPNSTIEPRMEVLQLSHAVASELEPILQELIEQSLNPAQPRGRNQPTAIDEPEPKIIADPRLDALIIYAVDSHMKKIKELIQTLDVPNTNYRQRIHFRPLRHTDASELADILRELISDTGIGSTRSSSRSSRSNRRSPTGGNTAGGAQSPFGGSSTEGEPVIIADTRSNSLIIHASPTQFTSIDDLITRLDNSRPQVLIETALVELTLSDQLTLGVELFSTSDDVIVDTDNDGIGDALTNETDFFTASTFGLGNTITQDIGGVLVPTNRSPSIGTGVTAGIFKDGRLPLLLSAFRSSGRAKILTMPSVVTNDNEQAQVSLSRTTSFLQNINDDNGRSVDSFQSITATTNLTISPTISSDNYLRLTIDQSVENFGNRPSPNAPPDQVARSINTNVTIPDRYTVVLGGLVQEEERSSVSKVPFLGDIPVIGWLFRQSDDQTNPQHLFLFVTPRILRDTDNFSEYHRLTWEKKLLQDDLFGSEVRFINGNFRGPDVSESATDKIDRLELSGELDAPRLSAPLTDAERIEQARRAAGTDVRLPPPPERPEDAK